MSIETVSVFCASSMGHDPALEAGARELGHHLGEAGVRIVFGGSDAGLMGVVSNAAMAAGGEVVGVYPRDTFSRDVSHPELTELLLVDSMHERKQAMYERSDAVIALPGGFGTLEELFEALTWTQLGIHSLPAVVFDIGGFWDPFVHFLDGCVASGVLKASNRALLDRARSPREALERLAAIDTAYREKWSG